VVVVLVACTIAGATRADATPAGHRVYVANRACSGHAYRPQEIVLACGDAGFYATGLVYRSYGGSTATASGQLHTHNCIPNCARSKFHAYPGTLTLARVVRCTDGRLYYSRARYRFEHHNPSGPSAGTADIEPFGRCSAVHG
jgi:hypothetical protein